MSSPSLQTVLHQLVAANHILHYHNAVDGFGHVSVRHPEKPHVYIMCGYMPPALVENAEDLIEYHVNGSAPVHPDAPKGYSERFIHGELFKRFPEVQCVVHSHAEAVLPYVSSNAELKPMVHMSGFLGTRVPVWDITSVYDDESHQQDMLVNNETLGASLAAEFSGSASDSNIGHNVVLQKRHGLTTWGKDIATAVYRAVYTLENASIQTNATILQNSLGNAGQLEGLSSRHCKDCQQMTEATEDKAWRLWIREVERNPLYKNRVPETA